MILYNPDLIEISMNISHSLCNILIPSLIVKPILLKKIEKLQKLPLQYIIMLEKHFT